MRERTSVRGGTEPLPTRANANNAPLMLYNLGGGGEFAGNASNDAKLIVDVTFAVHNFE